MVGVFKTNVMSVDESSRIIRKLQERYPAGCINFDLEDCDCILRVEDELVCPETTMAVLKELGYVCEELV